MAELSDDSLSDDDALKSDDGDGGGLGGLVFHWATDPLARTTVIQARSRTFIFWRATQTYESSTWDLHV